MLTAGVVVVVLAAFLLVAAATSGALHLHSRLRLRRLRAAVPVTCAELTAGRRPRWALVLGTTAPGPDGLLRSPAFDDPCVWFRTEVVDYSEGTTTLASTAAQGLIAVRDATGTVLLDPRLVLQELPGSPLLRATSHEGTLSPVLRGPSDATFARLDRTSHLLRGLRGALLRRTLTVEETIIEAGRPVTVLASPRHHRGVVLLGRWGASSTEEPGAWARELDADGAGTRSLVRFLLVVGLVLGGAGTLLLVAALALG